MIQKLDILLIQTLLIRFRVKRSVPKRTLGDAGKPITEKSTIYAVWKILNISDILERIFCQFYISGKLWLDGATTQAV